MILIKRCSKCNETKTLDGFYGDKSKPDGKHPKCKDCHKRYAKNKRATDKDWRARCIKRSEEYRKAHPEKVRDSIRWATIKKKYGITKKEYTAMLNKQGGGCAICGSTSNKISWGDNLHVDHDHDSGKVRGLLCQNCNVSLGKMHNSPEILESAASYLRSFSDR